MDWLPSLIYPSGCEIANVKKRLKWMNTPRDSSELICASSSKAITFDCDCLGHSATIEAVAWSPSGRFIASGSRDRSIRVWSARSGRCVAEMKAHQGSVFCVAWSPNEKMLASGSEDTTVRIWDVTRLQSLDDDSNEVIKAPPTRKLKGHTSSVCSVAWTLDGRMLKVARSC